MRISDWSSDVCSSDLSGSPEYQLYALKQLSPEDMDLHRDRLVKLVGESIQLNRLYIMKKMPDAMWDDPEIQQGVRSEERRVGKEWVSTCRTGWWPSH